MHHHKNKNTTGTQLEFVGINFPAQPSTPTATWVYRATGNCSMPTRRILGHSSLQVINEYLPASEAAVDVANLALLALQIRPVNAARAKGSGRTSYNFKAVW
jgi:hypothetical protein